MPHGLEIGNDFSRNPLLEGNAPARLFHVNAETRQVQRGLWIESMIHESSNAATQAVVRTITGTEAGPELAGRDYAEFRERRMSVKRWLESLGVTGIHSIHPTYNGGGDLFGRDVQLMQDTHVEGGLPKTAGTFANRQAMTAVGTAKLLANHHLTKPVLIGEIQDDGQFDVVWQTESEVPGDAWSDVLPEDKGIEADWTDPATGCGHFDTATNTCTTAPAL